MSKKHTRESRKGGVGVLVRGGSPENSVDVALFQEMRETLGREIDQNELLQESIEDLQRSVDEIGWLPLGTNVDGAGLRLDTIRKASDTMRAMVAANPMVKKGIRARIGFIWGEGIHYGVEGGKGKQGRTPPAMQKIIDKNNILVFSDVAYEELETAAATDGTVVFVLDKSTQQITRMPITQISDWALDPDNGETFQFIKRQWSVRKLNTSTGEVKNETIKVWYPTVEYAQTGASLPATINGDPVEQNMAINIVQVNKQLGWVWGVPDLMSVLFWARAYKEFLESQYTLVRSLARFAFKITDTRPKGAGAKSAAIKVATPNGSSNDTGATTTLPGGMDLMAINKAGANVDFEAGKPLATMVAAGLEIPLSALLSEDAGSADALLDPTTAKAMQARQRLWAAEFARMFTYFGVVKPKITFPPIQAAPVHRVVQAIVTAAASGVLFPEEVRGLMVKAMIDYGIDALPGIPAPGEWAKYANPVQANPGTSPLNTPDPTDTGTSGRSPAGALADGDHEQRKSAGPES